VPPLDCAATAYGLTEMTAITGDTPLGATLMQDGVVLRIWAPQAPHVYALTDGTLRSADEPGFAPPADTAMARLGDDNRSLYFTDEGWVGGNVFAYWNQNVRQFLIDNAVQCLEDYHVDGIRCDEVSVIEADGGGRFCQDLTSTVRFIKPEAIQIAEYWADYRTAPVRRPPEGLGFDAAWGDRLRDGIRAAIAQSAARRDAFVDSGALADSFDTPAGFVDGSRVVNCTENHDIVFDSNQPRIPWLADGSNPRSWFARSRDIQHHGDLLTWWDDCNTIARCVIIWHSAEISAGCAASCRRCGASRCVRPRGIRPIG
jgi:hypothetical protein